MGLIRRRAKRLESAISICLLAILLAIAVGVLLKQSDYDMGRFGIDTAAAPKLEVAFDLGSLAPSGFETPSKTEVYNPENLYEKIDGKAPLYTDSGFEKLSARRFVSKNRENLGMELYVFDMGNVKNAFSVYSVQKRAGTEILPDMASAYKTSNAIYFVHGKYYIELVGFSESEELFKAMTKIAQRVSSVLAVDKATEIDELGLFPPGDIVPGSFKLYLTNAFGFEGLTDIFTARYEFDNQTITAFLSKRTNSEDARTVAESYRSFLIENGAVVKQTTNKILEGKVVDFYDTTEIVFAIGPFVAGIHEAEAQQPAEKLALTLISKLGEAAGND